MTITLEPLTLLELERGDDPRLRDIWKIRAACARDLYDRFGDGHWARMTPLTPLAEAMRHRHLYVVRCAGESIATFMLSRTGPAYLTSNLFAEPDAPAVYLTALAVLPARQHQGVGRWCMMQAEATVRAWECSALRFDAYDHAAGAWAFYDRAGYQRRGVLDVYGVRLIAYERVLERIG